ncbi:enoyl-CoA hydratase-related protein [Nocardioides sp. NPDC000445]|uniref:enoyl-CoA hydratase-related protein n=1 Tax=Nocardioides sp. NPDC000445 TaxID=3154257 RepID=UPI00332533B9
MIDPYDGLRVVNHGAVVEPDLDRPGVGNALNTADQHHPTARRQGGAADPAVPVTPRTGAGPEFCAGGNIAGVRVAPADLVDRFASLTALVTAMLRGRQVIIAAVEGDAYRLGLASSRDLVLTVRSAWFAAAFVKLGLTADIGFLADQGGARERVTGMAQGLAITRQLIADLPAELDAAVTADNAAQTELLKDLELSAAQAAFLARRPACVGGTR